MLAWIAFVVLVSAVIGGVASACEWARGSRAAGRRGVWIVAMGLSGLLPLVVTLRERAPQPAVASATGPVERGERAEERRAATLDRVTVEIWATSTLLLVAWFATLGAVMRVSLRGRQRRTIAGASVIISPDLGPAVLGVMRPRIVVPQWLTTLGDTDQMLIVMHEQEHVRARDPLTQLVGVMLVVAMPWNLPLWWQLRRLRLAIELDCDGRVVTRGGADALRYSEVLLSAHRASRPMLGFSLALALGKPSLVRRIETIVGRRGQRAPRWRVVPLVALSTLLTAAFTRVSPPPMPRLVGWASRPSIVQSVRQTATRSLPELPAAGHRSDATAQPATGVASPPARGTYKAVVKPQADVDGLLSQIPPARVTPSQYHFDPIVAHSADQPKITRRGGAIMRASGTGVARPLTPRPDSLPR